MGSTSSVVLRGALATCFLTLAACRPEPEVEATRERALPGIAPTQRSLAPVEPGVLQQPTPAAVMEYMRARLRLSPDRRFLSALGRIDRFGGTAEPAEVRVSFAERRWHVRAGQTEIGTLPELPTFADYYALLLARAELVAKQQPAAAASAEKDDAAFELDAFATLQEIDKRWDKSKPSAAAALRAARAYAVLSLQVIDKLDVADALFAQALAAMAFAEALAGRDPVREKALLSRMMDYGQTASTLAATLPEDDVVRSFVNYDVAALVAHAKEHKDDLFSALLALRLVISRAQTRDAEAYVDQAPDAIKGSAWALAQRAAGAWGVDGELRSIFSALIAMREALGNPVEVPDAARYPHGGLREDADLKTVETALQVPYEQVIPQTERLLGMIGGAPGGTWLPADARAAFYRAQTFSALDALVRFYIDHLNAPDAAKEAVAMLGNPEGKLGGQFQRFAKDIIRAERRTLPLDALVKDIRELGDLGLGAIDRLWEPLREQGFYNSVQQKAAVAIVERCDGRVDCQNLLTDIAYFSLNDLVTDEVLRRSVLAEAPYANGGLQLRSLRMDQDRDGFLALLRDPRIKISVRVWHLQYRPEWLDAPTVRSAFEALVREAPTDLSVRKYYVEWLREQKDDARAIKVVDEWLAQGKSDHALDPIIAHTMRARALQHSGHADDAWKEIEPLLPSMYGGAMTRAAYVKSEQGDAEAAVALAKRRLERYSDSGSVGLLAGMLWKADHADEAAALLESWSNRLSLLDWTNGVADAFLEAYRDKPEEGAKAYAVLLEKNVDQQGVREMIRENKFPPELSFRTLSQVRGAGYQFHYDVARGYMALKGWKGETEAHAWIEKQLPKDEQRFPLSQHGYTTGAYELLWNFVTDPKPGNDAAFVWMMRAATYLRTEHPDAEWKTRLDQYYAQPHDDMFDRLGMHLLGKLDQTSIWASAKDDHDRTVAAWVFGFKAQHDGDIAQAVDWYRATQEAARGNSGEYQWSSDGLESLRGAYKSLALLTREAKAQPATP